MVKKRATHRKRRGESNEPGGAGATPTKATARGQGRAAKALIAEAGIKTAKDGETRPTGLPAALAWPADKVERWPIGRLMPYAMNARTHSPEQVGELVRSIETYGWTNAVLVDEKGEIIAGHGRVMAAERLGLKAVPVAVAVGWTETQKRSYRLADNKLALNAGWDIDFLRQDLTWLGHAGVDPALMGFNDVELVTFLATPPDPNKDPNAIPKSGPPVTRPGDLWQLGKHRLFCGDATNAEHVTRALDGAKPNLMVTDPPYGTNYDPTWRVGLDRGNGTHVARVAAGEVHNDDRADWSGAWRHFAGDVAYVWFASLNAVEALTSLRAAGFIERSLIIWRKEHFTISRGDYHWQHEPCWYVVRKGRKGHWNGDRKQTSIWDIGALIGWSSNRDGEKSEHSTQKPVECMAKPIRNNSKPGDVVYDPFCGSGSTIIAAEGTNRQCRALELNPGYVDLAVRRWQTYAGANATLAGDGRTFEAIAKERGAAPSKPKSTDAKAAKRERAKAGA